MEKTFLLGVGCQKGGTTWLYNYLFRHPQGCFYTKEYHILDVLHVPRMANFHPIARDLSARLEQVPTEQNRHQRAVLKSRIAFAETPTLYLDHFADIVRQRPETRVVGDITPSYAALPEAAYRWVARGMAERGLRTRVILLMRDPVERVVSHFRMARRKTPLRFGDLDDVAAMETFYRTWDVETRTRYEVTLRALDAAFASDEVLCLFYEELFSADTVARICDHLGISRHDADFGAVNRHESVVTVDVAQRRRIAEHYADTYAVVADRFGRDRLETLWKTYAGFF